MVSDFNTELYGVKPFTLMDLSVYFCEIAFDRRALASIVSNTKLYV